MLSRRSALRGGFAAAIAPLFSSVRAVCSPASLVTDDQISDYARSKSLPIHIRGDALSGVGWQFLRREVAAADVLLLGEEHGTAEIPLIAAAFLHARRHLGTDRVVIETSPTMATALDSASRLGVRGIADFCRRNGLGPPFYAWENEARFLAIARAAAGVLKTCFWGIDYEIYWQDRFLIERLKTAAPRSARGALERLDDASKASWMRYKAGGPFVQLFGVDGDPDLIRAVQVAWRSPDPASASALQTLLDTVETNKLFLHHAGFASNQRRAATMRRNLVSYLTSQEGRSGAVRLLVKMGAEHVTRGLNDVGSFDVGSFLPEWAAANRRSSFSVLALSASGTHSVIDSQTFRSAPQKVSDVVDLGLTDLLPHQTKESIVLDLRPLRPVCDNNNVGAGLRRYINGFDAVILINEATADRPLLG